MTVTHIESGYLERPYLSDEYMVQNVDGYMGQQAKFTINGVKPVGMQCEIIIVDRPTPVGQQANVQVLDASQVGQQAEFIIELASPTGQQAKFSVSDYINAVGQQANLQIANALKPVGQQAYFEVLGFSPIGQQAEFLIANFPDGLGQQCAISILGIPNAVGMEYTQTNINHLQCPEYLTGGYLEGSYLSPETCAHGGHQIDFQVTGEKYVGQQNSTKIADFLKTLGQQTNIVIADVLEAIGQQVEIQQAAYIGQQATISLYNTTNLRVLCSFPSRGLSTATGLNSWGFDAGVGESWKSNSTATGDFSPFNLNTDIVEEVWRSVTGAITGVNLDCDTERPQGVFLDTLAILNHNLTSSATITLVGSNSPTFVTIGVSIPLEARNDDPNIYYIAPSLPTAGYRYWRISIDDSSNPDDYLQIGTVVFGATNLFVGECFVDQVDFQLKDYTDSVQTEAFTNVNNSRAQKKIVRLEFRSLSYLLSNFRLMRSLFRTRKTVNKCLWIPTPSAVNQEYTSRFAVFSKLVQIPNERHNHKGGDADYVSFLIELDESK